MEQIESFEILLALVGNIQENFFIGAQQQL